MSAHRCILVIVIIATLSQSAYALKCREVYENSRRSKKAKLNSEKIAFDRWLEQIWKSDDPILIKAGEEVLPITLSFDGELTGKDTAAYVGQNPKRIMEFFKETLEYEKQHANWIPSDYVQKFNLQTPIPTPELIRTLSSSLGRNISGKEFNSFFVKKDFRDQSLVAPENLTTQGLDLFLRSLDSVDASVLTIAMGKYMGKALQAEGMPIKSHIDGTLVELTHATWETRPSTYKALMKNLFQRFRSIQMHFHFGMPTALREQVTTQVSRTIEAMITLSMAKDAHVNTSPLVFSEGTFFPGGTRGVVKAEYALWKQPHSSSDIEIRQWDSPSHGMMLLSAGIYMTVHHKDILYSKIPMDALLTNEEQKEIVSHHGSLVPSLYQIGTIFLQKKDSRLREHGQTLVELAKSVEVETGPLSQETAKKVSTTLRQMEIDDLLIPDNFLAD